MYPEYTNILERQIGLNMYEDTLCVSKEEHLQADKILSERKRGVSL